MTTDNIDSILSPTIHDWQPSDGYIAPALDEDAERARFEVFAAPLWGQHTFNDPLWRLAKTMAWQGWLAAKREVA